MFRAIVADCDWRGRAAVPLARQECARAPHRLGGRSCLDARTAHLDGVGPASRCAVDQRRRGANVGASPQQRNLFRRARNAKPLPVVWTWQSSLAAIYLAGLCALLSRLVIGAVRARVLFQRAELREGRLTSDSCSVPVTVGWLHPRVILPSAWQRWSKAQLDAVLTHENEHVRRRDPLVQSLALVNRAAFWFHPLAWWIERQLSVLAEEACDAAVLARGHDPFEYSEYLMEMARAMQQAGARLNFAGMTMPGASLPRRIRRILEDAPAPRLSHARAACIAVACAAVSTVFTAGAVDSSHAAPNMQILAKPPPVVVLPTTVPTPQSSLRGRTRERRYCWLRLKPPPRDRPLRRRIVNGNGRRRNRRARAAMQCLVARPNRRRRRDRVN